MDDNDPLDGGGGPLSDEVIDWVSDFLHVNLRARSASPAPGGGGKPVLDSMLDTAEASLTATSKGTPDATATDFFFDQDKWVLTGSDKNRLNEYVTAYRDAKSTEKITLDGYASTEGSEIHNDQVAINRAKAVSDYLIGAGIPKDKLASAPHGPTARFSKTDLSQNRRVTIKPPPPKAPAAPKPLAGQPQGKGPMNMRGAPDLFGKEAKDAAKHVTDTTPGPPPANDDVPRAEVEAALKTFLTKLAQSQKTKTVRPGDGMNKVRVAEATLREGIEGEPIVGKDDHQDYEPDKLAKKIAGNLPPTIKLKIFKKFQALHAVDYDKDKSMMDHVQEKYEKWRDDRLKSVPEKMRSVVKKAMDATFEHGVPFVVDQAMKAGGVNSDIESEIKKGFEDFGKKVTGNTSGDNK